MTCITVAFLDPWTSKFSRPKWCSWADRGVKPFPHFFTQVNYDGVIVFITLPPLEHPRLKKPPVSGYLLSYMSPAICIRISFVYRLTNLNFCAITLLCSSLCVL